MAWTLIETIAQNWKLVFWDGGWGTEEGVYLETPGKDAVRIQVFPNHFDFSCTYGIDPAKIPADVQQGVRAHFCAGYVEVARRAVGTWDIVHCVRRGIHRIYTESRKPSKCDAPIQHMDGTITWDTPNAVPAYVKDAVRKAFARSLSEAIKTGDVRAV